MKTRFVQILPAAMLVIFPSLARASDVRNVDGQPAFIAPERRLERVECRGAYVHNLHAINQRQEELYRCYELGDERAVYDCLKALLSQDAKRDPNAVFTLRALPGSKNFAGRIESDGETKFSSLRLGYLMVQQQADLYFYRVGFNNEDPYTLEVSALSHSYDSPKKYESSRYASVPVRRQFLPDLIYYFMDGCTLYWVD